MIRNSNITDDFNADNAHNRSLNLKYFIVVILLFSVGFVIGYNYISYDGVTKEVNSQLLVMKQKLHGWNDDNNQQFE